MNSIQASGAEPLSGNSKQRGDPASTKNLQVHQMEEFSGRPLPHKIGVNKGNIHFAMAAHPGVQRFIFAKHAHLDRLVQFPRQIFAQSLHVLCVAGKTFTALDAPDSQTCMGTGRCKQQNGQDQNNARAKISAHKNTCRENPPFITNTDALRGGGVRNQTCMW